MVSHFENQPPSPHDSKPTDALTMSAPQQFDVIVPVFLKVTLTEEDRWIAEVKAQEMIRALPDIAQSGATIAFHSIIIPAVL